MLRNFAAAKINFQVIELARNNRMPGVLSHFLYRHPPADEDSFKRLQQRCYFAFARRLRGQIECGSSALLGRPLAKC